MMSVSSVVESAEIVETEERLSFASSERSSLADLRRDSEVLANETFALEVQRQLLTQSNDSDDNKV